MKLTYTYQWSTAVTYSFFPVYMRYCSESPSINIWCNVSLQKTTMDANDVSGEDDQKENESSENSSPLVKSPSPVLNFPELTPSQFGICAQSFAPSAAPKGERFWMLLLWSVWPLPCFTHIEIKQQKVRGALSRDLWMVKGSLIQGHVLV